VKIEKHNAHGMQLLVELKPLEALALAVKLIESAQKAGKIGGTTNFYFSTPCAFEDDNDRWVKTDFDVVVTAEHANDLAPTYPCGKEIVQGGMNSAPEFCNQQKGHEHGCYRR
jgi:hypothetical protein